ncbi:MAG: hypothetical protein ACLFPL_04145 [Candidatus Nanoarchaeia archaeon]
MDNYYNNSMNNRLFLSVNLILLCIFILNIEFSHAGVIGEAGEFSVQNNENHIITFSHSYGSTPLLFMTPKTQNNDDSAYIPVIHSINTTHANVSLCRDNGATTCDSTYLSEDVSYLVFDINKTNALDWIEVGTVNAPVSDSTQSFSFSKVFDNTPYVFSQAQTYNLGGNEMAASSWFTTVSTTGATIDGCAHPGTANDCSSSSVNEDFAYVAIDPILQNISSLDLGFESIGSSAWTGVTFTNIYSNPQMLVTPNSQNGAENPLYPWARSVISTGADVRYCEQEGANSCDSHIDEDVMWLVIENGLIMDNLGSPPQNENFSFDNSSQVLVNSNVNVNATVTDQDGNKTVESVVVNVSLPNSSITNFLLSPEIENLDFTTEDVESGVLNYTAQTGGDTLGEVGSVTLQNRDIETIFFSNSYSQTPVVIATPVTQNNDNSPLVPIIHFINQTQMNISLCRDNGATTCDNSYTAEEVHYAVFDINRTNNYPWIEVGYVNVTTNGGVNSFSFNKTFSNAPYVFGSVQSYNIDGIVTNGIGAHTWFPSITTIGADIVGCDHPGISNTCGGTAIEQFGYVAIDPVMQNISTLDLGEQSIGDSSWTAISFVETYIQTPRLFVGVNSESGPQDPAYPWARNLDLTSAEIRYCENDEANYCDTHNDEITRWFSLERGNIRIGNGGDDVDADGSFSIYSTISNEPAFNISELIVTINVNEFNNSASTNRGNLDPYVEIEFDSNSSWISVGNITPTGVGEFNVSVNNSLVLENWEELNFRNIRAIIRGVDYVNSPLLRDSLGFDNLTVFFDAQEYTGRWSSSFNQTQECGVYNFTSITSTDETDLKNSTNLSNQSFEIGCESQITLLEPLNNSKFLQNSTQVELNWNTSSPYSNLECDIIINEILFDNISCSQGVNSYNASSLSSQLYNWSVSVTNPFNLTDNSSINYFQLIFGQFKQVSKQVSYNSVNMYNVDISSITNVYENSSSVLNDIVPLGFSGGSFIPPFTTFSPINGTITGDLYSWNISYNLPPQMFNVSYIVSGDETLNYSVRDLFIVGVE